ncbi:hypothetical protein WJX74_004519 [Apatococcus lobatus]|uniref:Meiosis regulator and mRNA stability factor 1 n=1 Tax=Apatococcus lobatus TaxID=904363 RepID=A0AAW1QYB8_9CHLO
MPPKIPSGRPQPKLSKLMAQQAQQDPEDPSASAKFVFWDLQNTPLPAKLCTLPAAVLETLCGKLAALRVTVVTEVPASTELGAELLRALKTTSGVQLLTFLRTPQQATGCTAADYELKRAIQRFLLKAPGSGVLVVISSDINLLSDVYQAKDHGLHVHLLSETAKCGAGLLEAADTHQDWPSFLQGLFGDFSGAQAQALPGAGARPHSAPQSTMSEAVDLARRTVGIFKYPYGSDGAHVHDHAHAFGCLYGSVQKISVKHDGGGLPYAIINFETPDAAQTALLHSHEAEFKGVPVYPKPWYLPSQRPSSGDPRGATGSQEGVAAGSPASSMTSAEEIARRTVGIFHYPKNSDPAQVCQHAEAYGRKFGDVLRVSIKWGSGAQPYAILNFSTVEAALAAVEHGQRPVFMGTPVNPSAWRLPGQPLSSGAKSEGGSRPGSAATVQPPISIQAAEKHGPLATYPQAPSWTPPKVETDVTAVRVCYPSGFCIVHAKIHAAACASACGPVISFWAGGSVRAGNPCVGVQFSAPVAAAKMRYQQLPAVQGSSVSVLPWQGSRCSDASGKGQGTQLLLMYTMFPSGTQLQHAQEYAAKHLSHQQGINYAVATRAQNTFSTVLCVSAQPHALRKLQESFKTPSGVDLVFQSVTPDRMSALIGGQANTPGPQPNVPLTSTKCTPVAVPLSKVDAQSSGQVLPVIAALTNSGSRNMFLGIPGITNVASGMTEAGKKFSYTVFETARQLAEAREHISKRLTDVDSSGYLLEGEKVASTIDRLRRSMNLTVANGLFSFLRLKRGKQNLPAGATDALCCMAERGGQHWQVGTPNTLQYLTEVYCKGQEVSQCWLTWSLSKLGIPTLFGDRRSQAQLLEFLSRLVEGCENKLAVFNACMCETRLEILVTAADRHGLAMARNQLKLLSERIHYRLIPEVDNHVQAWSHAQKAIGTLPDNQDIFATTWSGSVLFCGARLEAMTAGIGAYEAAAHIQKLLT